MCKYSLGIKLARLAALTTLVYGLLSHPDTARAQGFGCSNFGQIAGNFSGVGVSDNLGFPISTFSFLAINNTGGVAVFSFFNNGFGTGGLTSFFTGSASISNPNTCLLVGTVFDSASGGSLGFVAKVTDSGREVLVSTPFDGFNVFTGTFGRD